MLVYIANTCNFCNHHLLAHSNRLENFTVFFFSFAHFAIFFFICSTKKTNTAGNRSISESYKQMICHKKRGCFWLAPRNKWNFIVNQITINVFGRMQWSVIAFRITVRSLSLLCSMRTMLLKMNICFVHSDRVWRCAIYVVFELLFVLMLDKQLFSITIIIFKCAPHQFNACWWV